MANQKRIERYFHIKNIKIVDKTNEYNTIDDNNALTITALTDKKIGYIIKRNKNNEILFKIYEKKKKEIILNT